MHRIKIPIYAFISSRPVFIDFFRCDSQNTFALSQASQAYDDKFTLTFDLQKDSRDSSYGRKASEFSMSQELLVHLFYTLLGSPIKSQLTMN